MKLKIIIWMLIISILSVCFINLSVLAAQTPDSEIPIDIQVNDQFIKTDVRPFMVNGTTYVPVRFVGEALCVDEINWDAPNASVTILKGDTKIELKVGQKYGVVNNTPLSLLGSVRIVNNRVFVPVRFIAENLGSTVVWDSQFYNVEIYNGNIAVPADLIEQKYSNDDLLWLARIIEAESSGEPIHGKVAVGDVILNRVNSGEYPDNIHDVIFDQNFGVQFQPVLNGTIYNTPSADSIISAKRALSGENIVGDSLFFLNPVTSTSFWISQNRTFYAEIGNHDFYL